MALAALAAAAPEAAVLDCGRFRIALDSPRVMGIVNVTPDSFSDGGRHSTAQAAIEHAKRLVAEGADLIDLGAESTRPGAVPVAESEELARLLPVLRGLRDLPVPISVDTYKPAVMRAALDEGAALINDVYALRQPGAIEAVARADCAVCLMHMQGEPQTMHLAPHYVDVVDEVRDFLADRVGALEDAGVARTRIVIDPGFGFGKLLEHNLALLANLDLLALPGVALLAGLSRKGMLGRITGKPIGERQSASVSAALLAVARGAQIVRVHDVGATVDALKVWEMVENCARAPALTTPRSHQLPK